MEQFNNIIEFRQGIYEHGLTKARDAQFELLDALLLSPPIRSFPELSLSPVFRRDWPSAYVAIEQGQQDQEWLESWFVRQIPKEGIQVFPLDGTDWPHPQARVLADRQYVHAASSAVNGGTIVAGHPYSVLAWAPERHSSWAPVVSVRRVVSHKTEVEVGVEQVEWLCQHRQVEMKQWFHLIAADGRYGNHRFFGPLKDLPCGKIARMRCDRVLYAAPGLYGGRGRPRVHGDCFVFKEPKTWGEAVGMVALQDERWGQVRLRRWDGLHAREDASTVFSVILVETHLERDKPCKPFWLGYQYPADQAPEEPGLQDLWYGYQHRWPVEPCIRFRKQHLYWTLPRFQTPERCDRWTMVVNIAQWELFLARDLVQDEPLPWQPAQTQLTPERVRQSLAGLFSRIGTPADPPQTRGNSPGWPTGRPRTRPERHKVVKKTRSKPKTA
jgi:hypothetical protein